MPEINSDVVAQVALLAREADDTGDATARAELVEFIAGLTEDEQYQLVAIMWIGRESFSADEYDDAIRTAQEEATGPTEDYLAGSSLLADYLEEGLEALGYSATDAEDDLM
ncbi:MAG: DUF3775 domain-containing protein [Mangrovicoccus sp.]